MNLRQCCQTVLKAGDEFGQTSFRHLAQKTKLSKTGVRRLYHRIVRRNQHLESSLWETEAGQNWLRLLATTGSERQKSRIESRLSSSFPESFLPFQNLSCYRQFESEGARAMAALGDLDGQ